MPLGILIYLLRFPSRQRGRGSGLVVIPACSQFSPLPQPRPSTLLFVVREIAHALHLYPGRIFSTVPVMRCRKSTPAKYALILGKETSRSTNGCHNTAMFPPLLLLLCKNWWQVRRQPLVSDEKVDDTLTETGQDREEDPVHAQCVPVAR